MELQSGTVMNGQLMIVTIILELTNFGTGGSNFGTSGYDWVKLARRIRRAKISKRPGPNWS